MIEKIVAYKSSDGQVVGTIEQVQHHELALIQSGGDVAKLTDVAKIVIHTFVENRDKVVDILTTTGNSKPKARAINGGTKKRKPRAAAAQPSETPAIGRADGATER